MTKVLMVTDGLWNGGAERQMVLLATSLPDDCTVRVLSMTDGPYRHVLEAAGVDVTLVPRRWRMDVTPAFRMWRFAADWKPDVVHSWRAMSAVAMGPYCRVRGLPLVNGCIRRGRPHARRRWLERLGLRMADVVLANSRAGLTAYGLADSPKAHVIYNGFDPSRLERIVAVSRDVEPHEGTVVIMAARMFPEKDWRLLIEAARTLAEVAPGLRFQAMGAGPDREALVELAADLTGAGTFEFLDGGLEALPAIAGADVGVLLTDPSAAEGCSNAVMEYMACGLPVVCTDSGGNPELVEDGVTGLLVPPGDADALVSALRRLHDDPEHARRMGDEGRARLEKDFTLDAMVSGFTEVYGSVIAGKRGEKVGH